MTDGISREDMLGVLRVYDALFDSLGFNVRLGWDEWARGPGKYFCVATTCYTACYADGPTSRLLWQGRGATQQDAREDMLRQAHSASGMPFAFSEEEAKMRIALAGEDAFRPACKNIEMFAGGFENL